MKPEFLPYSKLYRRRCAQLDLKEKARREFNLRFGGAYSSKDFNRDGWRAVIDQLNDLVNEPTPAKFRRRPPARRPALLDGCATPEQVDYLCDLAARVEWRLPDRDAALRSLIHKRAWSKRQRVEADQWLRGNGSLGSLPRAVAARAIRILKRMADAPAASVQSV